MRKIVLTTAAAAALVGFTGAATAQTMQQSPATGGVAKSQSTEHQSPSTMGGALNGNINGPGAAKAAQTPAQSAKGGERMGQSEQKPDQQKQMNPQRGAQEEKSGAQNERGAQEEKSGATEQRGAQEENMKSGATSGEQNASKSTGSRGSGVQLSQTQRSKIQAIAGRDHAARVKTNVNFNVAVGVKIPRTVHVEVLPEDIVEIVPQFKGFDYVVVGDNILIIHPDTLEIVEIIAA